MRPQPPSIHILPPPGPSVLLLSTSNSASPKSTSKVPKLFLAAHKVRFEVFVTEQHCSASNEIDADDATSWHWVIYATPSPPPPPHPPHDRRAWLESLEVVVLDKSPEEEEDEGRYFNKNNNKSNNNNNNDDDDDDDDDDEELVSAIPVATIRLVPFPPPPSAVEDYKYNGQAAAPLPSPPSSGEGVIVVGKGEAEEEEQGPTHTPTKIWNGKEAYIKLGRLATLPSHRGLGFGKVLVDTALNWAVENAATLGRQLRGGGGGEKKKEEEEGGWNGLVLVHAQRDVEGWYRSVAGFVIDEGLGVWIEEGIEHVGMWRRLDLG